MTGKINENAFHLPAYFSSSQLLAHFNASQLLAHFNAINSISAYIGTMSLITVIFNSEKADEDGKFSFLAGMSLLVGATEFSVMELVVATILSYGYRDKLLLDDKWKRVPLPLWTPLLMECLAVAQFVSGLVLCHTSTYPNWCIIIVIIGLFIALSFVLLAARKAWKNSSQDRILGQEMQSKFAAMS
ncbi:hypothetical protein IWW34DRAFT_794869 [Fusarium oxysporum f. sp. albedinis]|nr:hypothetical protein IWW34DRAFT_794869 [Fusarium oxysporum f. sp. albedinis]